MEEQRWYQEIFERLESVKDKLDPSDFKFYNIAHFPLLAKFTEKNAPTCTECHRNINAIDAMVASLAEDLNSGLEERKRFEKEKTRVETHLKRSHKMRFPGFYTSLCTFIGISTSFLISFVVNLSTGDALFNDITLITLALGLIVGMPIGKRLDKKIFLKNLQL